MTQTATNGTPPAARIDAEAARAVRQVTQYSPAALHPAPGQREVGLQDVAELLPSIEKHGQQQPVIAYHSKDQPPGHLYVADGNHRVLCARVLGRDVDVIVLDSPPTVAELLTIRVLSDKKRALGPVETGAAIAAWMHETKAGVTEASVNFSISQGYASKLAGPFLSGVPEVIEAMKAGKLVATGAAFLTCLPPEKQRELLPKVLGKKRDAVDAITAPFRPSKAKAKGRPLVIKVAGVSLTLRDPTPERLQAFLDAVAAALRRLLKEGLPLNVLPSLIAKA